MMDDWLNDKFDLDHDGELSPLERSMKDQYREQLLHEDTSFSYDSDDSDSDSARSGSRRSSTSQSGKKYEQAFQQYKAEIEAAEKASHIMAGIGWLLVLIGAGAIDNGDGITGFYVFGGIVLLIGIFCFIVAYKIMH